MYSHFTQEVRVVFKREPEEHVHYRIVDNEGQIIRKGKLSAGAISHNISTAGLPDGKYLFESEDSAFYFDKQKFFS
jgi:hypothetical protein